MSYKTTLRHLYSLDSPKIKLGLKNIKTLLNKIGNPQNELRCIHVAGTNGKGSTCAMIYSILRNAGYSVGLYTSPHLKRFNERIVVDDKEITDKEIVGYYLKIKKASSGKFFSASFFEITTAMAFMHFKNRKPDFTVLETGLGGRLDATNVVTPLVSVITNIGYEHTDILGSTLEKIAFEKAGIIRRGIPVITGADGSALKVIRKIAAQRDSLLIIVKCKNENETAKNINFKYLNGRFQYKNAMAAIAAIKALKNYHNIIIGSHNIKNGIENAKWRGRLQFIEKNILVDCAHNPAGIEALAGELKILKKEKNYKSIILVFGALKDKNYTEMAEIILPLCSAIIITKPDSCRALDLEILKNTIRKILNKNKKSKIKIYAEQNPKIALRLAKKIMKKKELVVATGSIYIVGEII